MYYLVTCLRNFDSPDLEKGYQIDISDVPTFTITKSHPSVSDIIFNNGYLSYIGNASFHELASNYFAIQLFNSDSKMEEEIEYKYLSNFMQYTEAFCTAMWFVKDNSVTISIGTISYSLPDGGHSQIRRNVFTSDAKAQFDITFFDRFEMNAALIWFEKIIAISSKKIKRTGKAPNGYDNLSNFLLLDVPSFQRAMHFLGAARRADFLPAKIASYISVLECLFAAKGDNTQKVAERAACLIAEGTTERIKVFNDVKDSYRVRSEYVHGSEIKGSRHAQMPEISSNLDDIVRKVLKKMFMDHPKLNYNNSNKKDNSRKNIEQVDKWFDELVLSRE